MKRYKKKSKRTGKYKSILEGQIAKQLGRKFKYETETLHYLLPKRYTPDFVLVTPMGNRVYIEVKGYFRYEDQRKMRAVKESNPGIDLRMFFPKDNKVQGSELLNSEWCEKYNFPYSVGKIPKEWLSV